MITLSPQCCWLLGLGQISGTPPRSIKKPRKMSSRCDPGRAKKKLPSHPRRLWFSTFSQLWGTSSTSMPRRFGCCVSVSFEFPSCFRISWLVPPCRTASLCISLSSLGCSLCLYLVDLVCHGDLDMSLVLLENLLAAAAATCGYYYSPTTTTTTTTTTTATYCYCYSFSSCC